VRRADNLTTFVYRLSWNVGASTSWSPQGLSRPVMGLLYLYLYASILKVRPKWGGEWSRPRPGRFTPGKDPFGPSWNVAPQEGKLFCPIYSYYYKDFHTWRQKTDILFSALHNYWFFLSRLFIDEIDSLTTLYRELLLGYYAACSGSFLPTFRDNLSVPSSWVKSSWPLPAAEQPKKVQFSSTSQRKAEVTRATLRRLKSRVPL